MLLPPRERPSSGPPLHRQRPARHAGRQAGLARRLAYLWSGPTQLPPALGTEWRLVAIRWLGILLMLPSLSLLGLPGERVAAGYAVLLGAAIYNVLIQRNLPRYPQLFASGYLTTFGDALLNVAMVTLGGGFATPLYFLLYTVTIASAMRYGYGPTALVTLTFVSFDLAERQRCGLGVDGPLLIRSGFLVLTGLLASYLREQAAHAEAARHRQLRQARHASLHDSLTGLPNRLLLTERLEQALAVAAQQGHSVALLFIDLDRMKEVNETFGHRYGDLLLQQTGCRLAAVLCDSATLARASGDEFAVVLPSATAADAARTATELLRAIEAPFHLDEISLDLSASMGIVVAPEHGTDVEVLLRRAQVAMHAAKTSTGKYAVYRLEQDAHTRERIELAADLKRAIEHGELYVVYQPIVSLRTGRIAEVEALVRWRHPSRGEIPPGEFIPLAEETGTILAIGRWVLEHACAQAAAWQSACSDAGPLVMSVNVSARQFQHADVVADVTAVLERTGLAPGSLKLEITETVAMGDPELTIAALWQLKGMGVRLAIDDFGTGYSSLGYLKRFPADTLKIDRVFVDGLGVYPEDSAIVSATIAFARAVGLSTTAEGVETLEQLRHVYQLGADRVQGYLCSRPLQAEELSALLSSEWLLDTDSLSTPPQPGVMARFGRVPNAA